jgi:hypothetical protein
MTIINVPSTPKQAFNPRRPAGALLLAQIEHLEQAVGREPKRIKRTEGQAARYIGELTAELLRQQSQTTAAPASRSLAPPVAPATAAVPASVSGASKAAPTKAHAAFNKTLTARVKAKRKTSKKTPRKTSTKATKRRRSR